jgi:hypothetical protein
MQPSPRINELLKKKVNMSDWKDVPGDNWVPDEEEPQINDGPESDS